MLIALLCITTGGLSILSLILMVGIRGVLLVATKDKKKATALESALSGIESDIRTEANMRSSDPFLGTLLMNIADLRLELGKADIN